MTNVGIYTSTKNLLLNPTINSTRKNMLLALLAEFISQISRGDDLAYTQKLKIS